MCTVTYVPSGKGAFLTSNRDEALARSPARPPVQTSDGVTTLLYPVDNQAGGTWIALKDGRDAGVLLNGGFEKHTVASPYRRSRGLVFLEILSASSPIACFDDLYLTGIEPFTLILFIGGRLFRCTWDGWWKTPAGAGIRPAAYLVFRDAVQCRNHRRRMRRLEEWLHNKEATREAILRFHVADDIRYPPAGHPSPVKNLKTVSITSIDLTGGHPTMQYRDFRTGRVFTGEATPVRRAGYAPFFGRIRGKIRRWSIRARHWEYWPLEVVYFPVLLYHLWQSLKAGSFFYFSAANPRFETGGMFGESKMGILDQIDPDYKPVTLLIAVPSTLPEVLQRMREQHLVFPVIAKPDTGERGWRVEKITAEAELATYLRSAPGHFLLQEYVDFPLELGVFYYRLPGESKGVVSSIVQKEFLTVTGNGEDTVGTLIRKNDRAFLQLPSLLKKDTLDFDRVPATGERVLLQAIGNHCLGTVFLDGRSL